MSAAAAHTPLFNGETTIEPEATFVYEYQLPLDSPRLFDWFFYVEDPQQGSSTRVVEFWCEALWELDDGGCRTDVIHPHRQFTAGQLHSDFECVYNVAGPQPLPLSSVIRVAGRSALHLPEMALPYFFGRFGLPRLPPQSLEHLKHSVVVDDSAFRAATAFQHTFDEGEALRAFRYA